MDYNPYDVKRWEGVTFVTGNSQYTIREGKLFNRPSIEGAEVLYVTGITDEEWREIAGTLKSSREVYTPELKAGFDKMALRVPKIPEAGLSVVIGITDSAAEEKQRVGLATSRLKSLATADL